MSNLGLQTLTWGTVAAAVVSALWLASGDSGFGDLRPSRDQADRSSTSSADGGAAARQRSREHVPRAPRKPAS